MTEFTESWPRAYPELDMTGQFRVHDEDFQVTELSNRTLKKTGPHLFLFIEKKGANTHWLARKIADHAHLDLKDVGYAGLKDRHGVTRQWFSLPVKDKAPDLSHLFSKDEFTLLSQGYYGVKLKRGALGGNQFRLVVRNIKGDRQKIEQRLELIRQRGVPNYFGPQRFGNNFENLNQAKNMFESGKRPRNKQKGSMYISAARSYLFNEMLSKRIGQGCWDQPIAGEVFGFAGSLRGFSQENTSEERQRWRLNKIHPTCALWGKNESLSTSDLLNIETSVADKNKIFSDGLISKGLKQERRASRMLIPDLFWMWQDDNLVLRFSLASGYFATSLLRELGEIQEAPREFRPEQLQGKD
ncbi:MAG: tRNA pseudouridine(13) synthase TruD [Bermanella sp.]